MKDGGNKVTVSNSIVMSNALGQMIYHQGGEVNFVIVGKAVYKGLIHKVGLGSFRGTGKNKAPNKLEEKFVKR